MNKSTGNMYPWINQTSNPLSGKCKHNCSYCSTNSFVWPNAIEKYSGEIRLAENEMTASYGKDNFIFVVAQNDLFAEGVPMLMIQKILDKCRDNTDNWYLFQSKNPKHFSDFVLPENSVICTTIETNRWYPKIMRDCPKPQDRAKAMGVIEGIKKYVTIEPIMDFDLEELVALIRMCGVEQCNVGSDSKGNNLPEPSKEKIEELIFYLQEFTTVVEKDNLKRLLK